MRRTSGIAPRAMTAATVASAHEHRAVGTACGEHEVAERDGALAGEDREPETDIRLPESSSMLRAPEVEGCRIRASRRLLTATTASGPNVQNHAVRIDQNQLHLSGW